MINPNFIDGIVVGMVLEAARSVLEETLGDKNRVNQSAGLRFLRGLLSALRKTLFFGIAAWFLLMTCVSIFRGFGLRLSLEGAAIVVIFSVAAIRNPYYLRRR